MKKVVFFVFWLLAATVSAQNISNVDFQRVGDEIVITYDLDESADVWLYVSLDGGKTYRHLFEVTGDVGRAVLPGKKRIVWNVLYCVPEGLAGQIRFKVSTNAVFFIDGIELEMVYVKGGTFMMGTTSEQGNDVGSDKKSVHSVTLSDYYISKFEVTQGLWEKVMKRYEGYKSGNFQGVGATYPVYNVDYLEALKFCKILGTYPIPMCFELPTEAQWEYAARGGMKSKGYKYSGSNTIDDVAWYDNNSDEPHPVGTKQPNELGIYDMSGNVAELCKCYDVLRGGSWNNNARSCCVSSRDDYDQRSSYDDVGFRLVSFRVYW